MTNCSCGGYGCKLCAGQAPPKIFIPIEPMGAVRTTQKQKFVDKRAKRYAEYKEAVALMARSRIRQPVPPGKAIILTDVTFYMPMPKSGKTTVVINGQRKQIKISEGMPHIHTPDLDNLLKGLKDSLKGIAWHDDARVYKYTNPQKVYSECPGIEFGIEYVDLF